MSAIEYQRIPVASIPETNRLIVARRRQPFAVGRPGDGGDAAAMAVADEECILLRHNCARRWLSIAGRRSKRRACCGAGACNRNSRGAGCQGSCVLLIVTGNRL